jgi:hypothetical protein
MADGGAKRIRAIEGQGTLLGRTMHGIAYDHVRDEIVVPQQFGQAILTFAGDATGEAAPKRVIRGPRTQLTRPDRLGIDPVNGEIYVPEKGNTLLVFSRDADGDVAPVRVLSGPATGIDDAGPVAIDPKRDLIVLATGTRQPDGSTKNALSIFDRLADGNVKPKRVITGIHGARNITLDPESGLIFVNWSPNKATDSYVGVWSVYDEGDVPPLYVIGGPNGALRAPRGVVLDKKNNSVIVSDKHLNAVLTFHIPEIFANPTRDRGTGR